MATISVNAEQVNVVSADEKAKMEEAFRSLKLIGENDSLDFQEGDMVPAWDPIKDVCKGLCDAAAASAIAWCVAHTGGAATAVCIAAAEAARNECKNRC